MVTATTALKTINYVFMLFMIGFCFFPDKMMANYGMDLSCPPSTRRAPPCDERKNVAFIYFVMSIMGVQMMSLVAMNSAMARDGVSPKAQSVTCFCNMIMMLVFVVSDGSYVFSSDYPAAFPTTEIYGNLVLFSGLAALAYKGWEGSGSVMPNFDSIIPSGRFGLPYTLGCVNLLFFGLPLLLIRSQFIEMYEGASVAYAALTPDLKYFALWMFGNVGKMILCNVATGLCTISAGTEDTNYRLLRAGSMAYMFYLGVMSKDVIINQLNGVTDSMRTFTFLQSFAVTFYQIQTWAGAPYTLKKA